MNLDISEIYHQYVVKVVIFSLFTFKRQIRQPNVYNQSVQVFLKRRLPWKINLLIDTGDKLSRNEEREIIIDQILNNTENYEYIINVTFTTPKKTVTMDIDLSDETKYEKFIYS